MSATMQVTCPWGGHQISAPASAAGKRVRCPICSKPVDVPPPTNVPVGSSVGWHVLSRDGNKFGPVAKSQLDAWVQERRIEAVTQLLAPGAGQWVAASQYYPELSGQPVRPVANSPVDDPLDTFARSTQATTAEVPATLLHPGIRRALVGTRPWVRILAILAFFSAAICVLGACGLVLIAVGGAPGTRTGVVVTMAFFYAIAGALSGTIGCYLWSYASAIDRFVKRHSLRALQDAMEAQQGYWTITGIVSLLYIGVVFLVVAAGFAGWLPR